MLPECSQKAEKPPALCTSGISGYTGEKPRIRLNASLGSTSAIIMCDASGEWHIKRLEVEIPEMGAQQDNSWITPE